MSLLNSKDIPETYIEVWLKKAHSSLTADEAIKHIYDQSLLGISETTEFNVKNKSEGQNMHYLAIHDLIHQLINETPTLEEKKKLLDTATEVMLEVFSGRSYVFIKKVTNEPIHLLHAQKLWKNAQEIGYTSAKLLQLKVCMFELLASAMRDFQTAKLVLEDIEKDRNLGLKLEPYYEALFKINKGFFECVNNVNYDEAIRNMSEALTILTPFKEYSEERLRAISNIAQYHALRGEINAADQLINQGKIIFKNSKNEVYNSLYVYVCSFVLNDQGKFEESIDILNKAKEYPNLMTDYQTLYHSILQQRIETLIKQYRLEEAQENLDEYEERIQKYFQGRYKTYLGLGSALYFKSLISLHKGVPTHKILPYLSEAIKLYNNVLQGDKKHRYQARTHFALGMAHAAHKDYAEALKAYLFSEEIYDMV